MGCKLGKSRLHDLQKLCYSFGLGSCRKIREYPDVSIAAKRKIRKGFPARPEEVADKKVKRN